jgi:tetratricopeptide (TPR) repeat protein
MALMHELRGDPAAANEMLALTARVEGLREKERTQFGGWIALLHARRGAFEEARGRLDRAQARVLKNDLGLLYEARCDVVAEEQSWQEAAGVVDAARAHAAEAGLVALPFFADRLEGRAATAAGDLEGALAALGRAAEGFASLGADWDQACTELSLAQALAASGDAESARENAGRALAVFERLGVVREREQASELLL